MDAMTMTITRTSAEIRRAATLAATAFTFAWSMTASWAAETASLEYTVKATYLYKFADFVEWPDGAFESAESDLVICVLGDASFGSAVEGATKGQRVGARAIAVRRLERVDAGHGCHILYAGGSSEQPIADVLAAAKDAAVLTVTDSSRGNDAGMIHFVIKDNRVRFGIDDQAAADGGISISSKLLSLAVSVKPRA